MRTMRDVVTIHLEEHTGAKELSSGIFWVLTDDWELDSYTLLSFEIPCDIYGMPVGRHTVELNSKNGMTYNHKKVWETVVQKDSSYRPYNKKPFDYYPRGRVQIAHNKAQIYLNQNIYTESVIKDIQTAFGLSTETISQIRVLVDNSAHYGCWIDRI